MWKSAPPPLNQLHHISCDYKLNIKLTVIKKVLYSSKENYMHQDIENINKQLQTVVGKILNKDYFKLEFGCKVKRFNEIFTWIGIEYAYAHYSKTSEITGQQLMYQCSSSFKEIEQFEILGQEPTLNDVLLAMFKKGKSCNVSQLGEIFEIRNGERYYGKIYDLKESLFNQSPETKLAIIKLLE